MMEFFNSLKDVLKKENDISILFEKNYNTKKLHKSNNKSKKNNDYKDVIKNHKLKKENNYITNLKVHKNTRVFFVVNKYNEIIKTSSRFLPFFSTSNKPKSIYFLFFSKKDAIDFLYKIAKSEPKSFKKLGLGINSFSLEKFVNLYTNNFNLSNMVLVNDLEDIEIITSNDFKNLNNINIINKSSFKFNESLKGYLAYSISSLHNDSNYLFFTLKDAYNYWKNSFQTKSLKKCNIKIYLLSFDQVKNLVNKK